MAAFFVFGGSGGGSFWRIMTRRISLWDLHSLSLPCATQFYINVDKTYLNFKLILGCDPTIGAFIRNA